jgi:hypothetical protein
MLALLSAGPGRETGSTDVGSDRVRDLPWLVGGTTHYTGVVEAVSDDELVLVETLEDETVREHRFAPCSVLRKGEIIRFHTSASSYRWGDIKRGDTVRVDTKKDRVDGLTYCLEVCILRRPGAKLPEGQDPKKDKNFRQRSILNDIDNHLDVSDEDIAVAFPKRVDPKDEQVLTRGGLPNAYQLKLDAIREKVKKKDGGLGAKSPDKK